MVVRRCVHTERVLKEWVHPATCANPELTAPKCQGTETCNLNHCVSFVPKDLFSATLAVSPRALERTTQAKSRPMASQFKDEVVYESASDTIRLVYITKVDKEELAVDGLVDVTSDSRGAFVKSQVTWVVQPPYEPAVRQPWIALNGSRVLLRAFQGQNKPTTVAITVRAWTPCGQIASKKYLLRVYQEGSPKLRVFSRVRKYIESLMVQENGSVSFLVLIGAVVVGAVGAVMWTVRRPRGGNDDGSAAYVLVGDSTML
ncbi:hypothetical protein DYB35_011264 [Aphanomyces astaci]|uniref:Uncharacterized protein n=1 Tax=Aphanomyces astaci TaxID=112090 RepID=A0A418CID2_APHAT|nr:hypothetical protein DYB35_011264 [Aphanomyces astaci]